MSTKYQSWAGRTALTACALLLGSQVSAAPVSSMSLEVFKEDDGRYWEVSVQCEGEAAPHLIRRSVESEQWCDAQNSAVCDTNKFSLSRTVCGETAEESNAAQAPAVATQQVPEQAAPEAQAPVTTAPPTVAATTAPKNTEPQATPESTAATPQVEAAPADAPAPKLSRAELLKEQMQIEEQRILIQQKRLELQRKELELKKRQIDG